MLSTKEFPSIEAYPVLHDLEFWKKFNGPFYRFEHVELARNHTDVSHVGQHYALWLEEKASGQWRDYFLSAPSCFPEFNGYPKSNRKHLLEKDMGA